ncbi:MAG TPA: hypothetical protein VMC83_14875 [Streptosporangiaceae bacterium]|nr:hypothetical protein [Streptosporangiaceae bacterium]
MRIWLPVRVTAVLAAAAVSAAAVSAASPHAGLAATQSSAAPTPITYRVLRQDVIINADIWAAKPEMMAAGLGFTNIVGVPNLSTSNVTLSKTLAVLAGGTWNNVRCANGQTPPLASYTSASTPQGVRLYYGQNVYYSDGLPVEFSWPILPSTLDADDFKVTLSNGTSVSPQVASIWPNYLYNERSVAVLFGHFGNRIPPGQPGAIYPVSVQVVQGSSTLELVGPGQRIVSAVGMSVKSPGSPYTAPGVPPADRGGPTLVAAKLSRMSAVGNTAPKIFPQNLPNDGISLYGKQAKFRLRMYTSGGMTPNGVTPLLPTEYDKYFRVVATTSSGRKVALVRSGKTYYVDGQPLRVVGLADLGVKQATYDACYTELRNNYIDIILDGSIAAARRITAVQIPSTGRYKPLYNPGGPGNNPAPGVLYSAPSPPISQPVTDALKNPMTVTYVRCRGSSASVSPCVR